jgi:hypothetical protein
MVPEPHLSWAFHVDHQPNSRASLFQYAAMEPLYIRDLSADEERRLQRVMRKGNGAMATWWRAQILLYSDLGLDTAHIAPLALATEDEVRGTIRAFNRHGLDSLHSH